MADCGLWNRRLQHRSQARLENDASKHGDCVRSSCPFTCLHEQGRASAAVNGTFTRASGMHSRFATSKGKSEWVCERVPGVSSCLRECGHLAQPSQGLAQQADCNCSSLVACTAIYGLLRGNEWQCVRLDILP